MELLIPSQTVSFNEARAGSLIIFDSGGEPHYGVICKTTAAGVDAKSLVEIAPTRTRMTSIPEGPGVLQVDDARIELIFDSGEIRSGKLPNDFHNFLGLEGKNIIAPFPDSSGHWRISDITTGELLHEWRDRNVMWFKQWRIVVPMANGIRILYDSRPVKP